MGEFEDGIGFRCGKGFYDDKEGHPQYYSPTALTRFLTMGVVRAERNCGNSFMPMKNIGREIGFID